MNALKLILIALAICVSFTVNARVFKCEVNGKTTYQSKPCAGKKKGEISLKVIRPTDEQIHNAQKRLDSSIEAHTTKKVNRAAAKRQMFFDSLEIRKTEASIKQANAVRENAVAHRKEAAIAEKRDELSDGTIRSFSERRKIKEKWNEKIKSIE